SAYLILSIIYKMNIKAFHWYVHFHYMRNLDMIKGASLHLTKNICLQYKWCQLYSVKLLKIKLQS
ncbi:hypothetical protein, partial [Staphylococcus aureus]